MPYVFPHENEFMIGVGILIVALLIVRFVIAHRRR